MMEQTNKDKDEFRDCSRDYVGLFRICCITTPVHHPKQQYAVRQRRYLWQQFLETTAKFREYPTVSTKNFCGFVVLQQPKREQENMTGF